jgi:hypothetical protein
MQRIKIELIILILIYFVNSVFCHQNKSIHPTIVNAGIYLTHIDKIDVKNQSFYSEFYLNLNWVGDQTAENFEFINSGEYNTSYYSKWAENDTNYIALKVSGYFRSVMDVSNFPLDHQKLIIRISDFVWTNDSMIFKLNKRLNGSSKTICSNDWNIDQIQCDVNTTTELGKNFSVMQMSIDVSRKTLPFIIKIFIPILIVVSVSMLNLFIPKKELETCINLGITSLLSIIALHFTINGQLPDVNYPTKLDEIMIGSYFFIFLSMINVVIIFHLENKNKCLISNKIDRFSKLLIPSFYILLLFLILL